MKLFKKLLSLWKNFYADTRHQRNIVFLVILIIGAAIPLTLSLESHNTDNRQNAMCLDCGGGGGTPPTPTPTDVPDCPPGGSNHCGNDDYVKNYCSGSYASNHFVWVYQSRDCSISCSDHGVAPIGQCGVSGSADAACKAVGGSCTGFANACTGGTEENHGELSCGPNTTCCVPQPSCGDVQGYCDSYGATAKNGYAPNSSFPGCGSGQGCFINVNAATNCGLLSGKCISVGSSCPSGYEVNMLGDQSCNNQVCCIPKGGNSGPVCGNGICESGENSSNCPADCGGDNSTSCPQTNQYNECEYGNSDYCLDSGSVPVNHLSLVTEFTCSDGHKKWSCQDMGPCNQNTQATPTPTTGEPTATPTPTGPSKAKLIVTLPGIGGRNGGNPNPHRYVRTVTLYFYRKDQDPTDPAVEPIAKKTGPIKLDSTVGSATYGYFVSNPPDGFSLGNLEGTYKVFVKTDSYLRKQFIPTNGDRTSTFTFSGGATTTLPKLTLIAGDIYPPASSSTASVGDNTLDISDYNQLINLCYGNAKICPSVAAADLNDDGNIDGIDYNILIRSFKILSDQGSQGGDGE